MRRHAKEVRPGGIAHGIELLAAYGIKEKTAHIPASGADSLHRPHDINGGAGLRRAGKSFRLLKILCRIRRTGIHKTECA